MRVKIGSNGPGSRSSSSVVAETCTSEFVSAGSELQNPASARMRRSAAAGSMSAKTNRTPSSTG